MERIASFCVDHTKLNPGIYLSRQDGDIITYDIRMKKPNNGDYIDVAAAHAIEHLFATFARNSEISDSIIYVGPMGCRTGFYLLTRGITHERAIQLVKDSFELIADFDGAVPGASEIECGNYREISLPKARAEASAFLPKIRNWTSEMLNYRQ
ncbi:MAG: S-ribosylhomocysteine lyase [Oscillospiraceae bacterium]